MRVLGLAFLLIGTGALAMRFLPAVNRAVLLVAALSPYLMLGAPLAAVLFAISRHGTLTAVASVITVVALATQFPAYIGSPAAPGPALRFVTANLRYGQADPAAVIELAQGHADVLAVQELTPELAGTLSAALKSTFAFSTLRPGERATGVGLWSRYPISGTGSDEDFDRGFITAQVRVPGRKTALTVVSTHLSPPRSAFQSWRADMQRLGPTLQRLPRDGPVVVGCDLNATPDVREFRRLLTGGYRDGAVQAAAGFLRTHPDDLPVPPVLAVDHVLTRDATVTSITAVHLPGSDHRALISRVALGG
jgi:endonuclease/exonuclease/phosphatase (EEP) superfamily protein YafD